MAFYHSPTPQQIYHWSALFPIKYTIDSIESNDFKQVFLAF